MPAGDQRAASVAAASSSAAAPSSSASLTATAPCCLRDARCNVFSLSSLPMGTVMHLDGDMLTCAGAAEGSDRQDPCLTTCLLRTRQPDAEKGSSGFDSHGDNVDEIPSKPDNGFFSMIRVVCSDAHNGLAWGAGDDGKRIKAFAPAIYERVARNNRTRMRLQQKIVDPPSREASCWQLDEQQRKEYEDAGAWQLKYTLSTDVKGMQAEHVGLHAMGAQLTSVNARGFVFSWDLRATPCQTKWREAKSFDDGQPVKQGDDVDPEDGQPLFRGKRGWRHKHALRDIEASVGELPQTIRQLPQPLKSSGFSASLVTPTMTRLLAGGRQPPMLVAGLSSNALAAFDFETLQMRQLMFGHVHELTGVALPPPSCQQAGSSIIASCSRSGDVKIWDLRARSAAPVITLVTGTGDMFNAVALASGGSSSGASQLGAGMLCFAGGTGECVWCWDLRGGHAQPLYELSTGNTTVNALAWHEATSSLIANCEGWCGDYGYSKSDFKRYRGTLPGGGAHLDANKRWWRRRSKHAPDDFREYFTRLNHVVLRYTFSETALQHVPHSESPFFGDDGGW